MYSGIEIPADGNDGLAVLLALAAEYARASAVAAGDEFVQEFSQRALAVLSRLVGPFSFVLYDQTTQYLWYGRDAVGRRSLLTRTGRRSGEQGAMGVEGKTRRDRTTTHEKRTG